MKDLVIFIRIFQSNMLISNIAQIHQNTILKIEAKTSCLFVFQAGNNNVCLGNNGWKIALSLNKPNLLQYIDLQYREIFKIKTL